MSRTPLLLALATLFTVVAIAAGTATAQPDGGVEARKLAPQPPRGLARPPLLGLRGERSEPRRLELVETSAASAPAGPPSVEILRTWDARRAQAWARGDARLLRALYTPGSVAGRRDLAMLRAWAASGLVVQQLRTQLLSVRELSHRQSARTLLVTDRLVGGVAVGAGVRRPLPQDGATTRTIRLLRRAGEWRIAWVLPGEVSA
jgi:hypothetical protein